MSVYNDLNRYKMICSIFLRPAFILFEYQLLQIGTRPANIHDNCSMSLRKPYQIIVHYIFKI